MADHVAAVREFNRFYTSVIGVLDEGLLRTPYSLTEARVIFELARQPAVEVPDLRQLLALDAGYLSRILTRFVREDLISKTPGAGRRQVVALTDAGRAVFDMLNTRSEAAVEAMLGPLTSADQARLVAAMRTVRHILDATDRPAAYVLRPLEPGDAGWIVHRHGVHGGQEATVARVVADHLDEPDRGNAWIAEVDGESVGCALCVRRDDETAQLRLLLVEPSARGMGIGSRLVDECVRFARRAGCRQIMVVTNEGRRFFEKVGFEPRDQAWWRTL